VGPAVKTITILQSITTAVVVSAAVLLYGYLSQPKPAPTVLVMVATPTREQVNAAVARLISAGRANELYAFYAQEVGDPTRAMLYTSSALIKGAPVDLVISVGWWEGGHQVGGVDGPNQNGSFDVRPMGLNTYTYRTYTIAELKQVQLNISQGVDGLASARVKWGVSWEAAMASYNHGQPTGLDQRQVDYVTAVLRHEWELDRKFAARFPDAL
jgi:hypothetical protein